MSDISYPLRILIVDDNADHAEVLASLIRKKIAPAQLEIFFSLNLEDGIKMSHQLIPCIVLLDLVFPENDWKTTCASIPRFRGAVVVVTEADGVDIEMQCRKSGALTLFPKSKIKGLIEIVVHVIANIRLNNLAREALHNGCA